MHAKMASHLYLLLACLCGLLLASVAFASPVTLRTATVEAPAGTFTAFTSGQEGYACYRIPSLIKLPSGALVAFAEGRKFTCSDHDWNDVVYKVSKDNGTTWGPLQLAYGESTTSHHVTIGNPVPIVMTNSSVLLVACRENKEVLSLIGNNLDSSPTWSHPRDLTPQATHPDFSWIATGPPQGLLLSTGRLVVSADHILRNGTWGSHAMVSDDGGATWRISNFIPGGNECQCAVAQNGSLVMNSRTRVGERLLSHSEDQGLSWSSPVPMTVDSVGTVTGNADVEGSIVRVGNRLVFSLPFNKGRENMTVFTSPDSGSTWHILQRVDPGPSAYSALIALNDTHAGLIYESQGYKLLSYAYITLLGEG
eukprot:m.119791 g.119791  ORF g.119791 m.119791 type:complete len:366 (-) comp16482_c0_seq1:64-1161(-)